MSEKEAECEIELRYIEEIKELKDIAESYRIQIEHYSIENEKLNTHISNWEQSYKRLSVEKSNTVANLASRHQIEKLEIYEACFKLINNLSVLKDFN